MSDPTFGGSAREANYDWYKTPGRLMKIYAGSKMVWKAQCTAEVLDGCDCSLPWQVCDACRTFASELYGDKEIPF